MKNYLHKTLKDSVSTWTILTIEILAASLLYASLSTFGVPQSISLLVSSSFAIILVSIGLLSGYTILPRIIAKPNKNTTTSHNLNAFSNHLLQSKIEEKQIELIEHIGEDLTAHVLNNTEQTKTIGRLVENVQQIVTAITQQERSFQKLVGEQNTILIKHQQTIEKLTQSIAEQQEIINQLVQSMVDENGHPENAESTQSSRRHESQLTTFMGERPGIGIVDVSDAHSIYAIRFVPKHGNILLAGTTSHPVPKEDAKILLPDGKAIFISAQTKQKDTDLVVLKSADTALESAFGASVKIWMAPDIENIRQITEAYKGVIQTTIEAYKGVIQTTNMQLALRALKEFRALQSKELDEPISHEQEEAEQKGVE